MQSVVSASEPPGNRRAALAIRAGLRELSIQLSLLNHQVGSRLGLKDVDLDCLDLVVRHGPLSPSALARAAGLHPATTTGVLDRLERAGWITRDRDPKDRRAVTVSAKRERNAEVLGLYAGMNGAMNELLAGYDAAQLAVIADFVDRTTEAGRRASDKLLSELPGRDR